MSDMIRISGPLTINETAFNGIYITDIGNIVFDVPSDSIVDMTAIRSFDWNLLNDICSKYTANEYGTPQNIMDLLSIRGYMTEADIRKLRLRINGCLNADSALLYLGERPVENIQPIVPTTVQFVRLFSGFTDIPQDALTSFLLDIESKGIEVQQGLSDLKIAVGLDSHRFSALTFDLTSEIDIFFDSKYALYGCTESEEKAIEEYIDDLAEYGGILRHGKVVLDPTIISIYWMDLAELIRHFTQKLQL